MKHCTSDCQLPDSTTFLWPFRAIPSKPSKLCSQKFRMPGCPYSLHAVRIGMMTNQVKLLCKVDFLNDNRKHHQKAIMKHQTTFRHCYVLTGPKGINPKSFENRSHSQCIMASITVPAAQPLVVRPQLGSLGGICSTMRGQKTPMRTSQQPMVGLC